MVKCLEVNCKFWRKCIGPNVDIRLGMNVSRFRTCLVEKNENKLDEQMLIFLYFFQLLWCGTWLRPWKICSSTRVWGATLNTISVMRSPFQSLFNSDQFCSRAFEVTGQQSREGRKALRKVCWFLVKDKVNCEINSCCNCIVFVYLSFLDRIFDAIVWAFHDHFTRAFPFFVDGGRWRV